MNDKLKEIYDAANACTRCPLHRSKQNCVFGCGDENAELMFIGEAPGEAEDNEGVPFVGAAGKLLDRYLYAVDIDRSKVYIANILKCRPPKNRDPLPEEQAACTPWLMQQIEAINPKIIVCLGRIAACYMIDPDFKVMKQHGEFLEKDGRLMMGMLHPAAILRNPNQRSVAFADFVTLRDKIKEICTRTELVFPE